MVCKHRNGRRLWRNGQIFSSAVRRLSLSHASAPIGALPRTFSQVHLRVPARNVD
jgi:hypothetical protein